ncbi:DsbA family protein [Nocardioides sp. zg-DK7169]|uniref:DsbA family protein n=1 Tax=Nocardioides sp. zg-DK7169 TaxID=2736600 RepID=UPI0015523610|nr:DsbA family protein [Nocardioides sp. zg-DK7169]NPC97843.1 thioredoxin domain-containing protein [Nocardioides sp. zg-DK7169]
MSKKNTSGAPRSRAAAVVAQQQAEERRRRLFMIGGVVVALLMVIVAGVLVQQARDTSSDVDAPVAGGSSTGVEEFGLSYGDPSAPHTVVVYEDFLCPYCGLLEKATRDDLDRLAEEGKVFVEYRPFNLLSRMGDYSARAANAFRVVTEESGPETAKRFHQILFDNQPEEGKDYPDDDQLVAWAVEAGAEEDAVRPGIEDQSRMDWVEAATKSATDSGVRGTPTVLLDGEVFQASGSVDDLADALAKELEG